MSRLHISRKETWCFYDSGWNRCQGSNRLADNARTTINGLPYARVWDLNCIQALILYAVFAVAGKLIL